MIGKALWITDKAEVDGRTILSHTVQGLEISAWVQLAIEWTDSPQLQLLIFIFQCGQQSLLPADFCLQITIVQERCFKAI